MKFCRIGINNFRNFEHVELELGNKNLFFGLNDVGKTNFLYALRFLLDYSVRRDDLQESDFYKQKTERKIEIWVEIGLEDDVDSKMLRSELREVMRSNRSSVYIKLEAEFDVERGYATPRLSWGVDISNLSEMGISSGGRYQIDNLFDVTYVNSYVDLEGFFKKTARPMMKSEGANDKIIRDEIEALKKDINLKISQLSGVAELESKLTDSYNQLGDEGVNVRLQSGIDFKHEFSGIMPYFDFGDEKLYPTGGDGRKKLLTYALYNIKNDEKKKRRIRIMLVEEPENHLHKSLQIMLSRMVFSLNENDYIFLTTHSPFIIQEMNNVKLIRVYSNKQQVLAKSYFYSVPKSYQNQKSCLNRSLSEALFANRVLLVEGPSEFILFTKVLEHKYPFYESKGLFVLPVNGVSFKFYRDIFMALGIKCIIKTDNDLQKEKGGAKYLPIGFRRCNDLTVDTALRLPETGIDAEDYKDVDAKVKLYNDSQIIIAKIAEECSIFLSQVDLENDLGKALGIDELNNCLDSRHRNPVSYLQQSKMWNMSELVSHLEDSHLDRIFENANFKCLKTFCHGIGITSRAAVDC